MKRNFLVEWWKHDPATLALGVVYLVACASVIVFMAWAAL